MPNYCLFFYALTVVRELGRLSFKLELLMMIEGVKVLQCVVTARLYLVRTVVMSIVV